MWTGNRIFGQHMLPADLLCEALLLYADLWGMCGLFAMRNSFQINNHLETKGQTDYHKIRLEVR